MDCDDTTDGLRRTVVDLLYRSDRIFELVSLVRCLDILVVVEDLVVEDLEIIRSNVKFPQEIIQISELQSATATIATTGTFSTTCRSRI
jgi:hypothetical protein